MARDPLTVLPSGAAGGSGPLRVTDLQLVGNYAVRLVFSDGHRTGIYSWRYLREIDPDAPGGSEATDKPSAGGDAGGPTPGPGRG